MATDPRPGQSQFETFFDWLSENPIFALAGAVAAIMIFMPPRETKLEARNPRGRTRAMMTRPRWEVPYNAHFYRETYDTPKSRHRIVRAATAEEAWQIVADERERRYYDSDRVEDLSKAQFIGMVHWPRHLSK